MCVLTAQTCKAVLNMALSLCSLSASTVVRLQIGFVGGVLTFVMTVIKSRSRTDSLLRKDHGLNVKEAIIAVSVVIIKLTLCRWPWGVHCAN